MRKEKGKKKMPEYCTNEEESDRSESHSEKNKGGPLETKYKLDKRAQKSANDKLH